MTPTDNYKIWSIENKQEEKFLRTKTKPFDFAQFDRKEINALVARMKQAMKLANGIGLSANQIGLPYSVFVAQVSQPQGGSKFYAMFNPRIESISTEKVDFEEGCLSVPRLYGNASRAERLTVAAQDKNGKKVKVKAWGLTAIVFQHEIDHLNGKLFIDKAKETHVVAA